MEILPGRSRAHVLVLPGGRPVGTEAPRPWHASELRMTAFTHTLGSRLRPHHITVEQVRYRYRGWNGTHMSPVRDALEALDRATRRGHTRIGLVGHSMGGRVAAHLASQGGVESVVALAPWWPENDSEHIPIGRHLLVAHGTEDHETDPRATQSQTMAARDRGVNARWRPLPGAGHLLLTDPGWWARTTADFLVCTLTSEPLTSPGDDHAS
ncbi:MULTISPECIES: alpha/beta hydrolase [unclassified Rhodococcus (in: high G+C Gram-positive bacteria)]|jgi:pimeloyl-ACP methyl ester carboxylesterase|uniref:alpha/beta hydrolase n=1 Tax=unclassified Rhodococcus (in: high G+C Gram-positive bacteria) TaxID=192944 RepID=UPI00146A4274|nr:MULTISPECIES: alpha/beta fold hydrolase [unclassified Rhodococcus (in: high G+C Gram-positive bacteria)]MBF0662305.1 alpha/beta fold hydrolase [Rhodococcus sp. (in: high G+C Gram-positive bacteria)]NMD95554.1 alpha/beta fold hydrolase [Rhodococcus sp. BL-253-APC-6A1W]NME79550.1 alpha/beta fold hydrolase [Rhodococcus sp. 105337]